MIKVTILGSGTGVPSLERSSCSVYMEIGAERLLFDMGAGTMRRLLEAGSAISLLNYIFFSHEHPDHTGEFASFLFAAKYPKASRLQRPFIVLGKGIKAFHARLLHLYGNWMEMEPGVLNLIDLGEPGQNHLNFPDFEVDVRPAAHIESSIGYRVTASDGTTAVYTGDTGFSAELVELARNADLLITESSLPDEMQTEGHLTPALAGSLARQANAKELLLTHFYPQCDSVDIEAQCRKTWSGPLRIARDLMEIQVSHPGQ